MAYNPTQATRIAQGLCVDCKSPRVHYKTHCDECRAAQRIANRLRDGSLKTLYRLDQGEIPHGLRRYWSARFRCRCATCKQAYAMYRQVKYANQKEPHAIHYPQGQTGFADQPGN